MLKKKIIKNRIISLEKEFFILKKKIEYNNKNIKFQDINKQFRDTSIWQSKNKKNINKLRQELSLLQDIINNVNYIEKYLEETKILLNLAYENNKEEKEIFEEININLNNLEKKINNMNYNTNFSEKYDYCNCYIDIKSGSGGIDAQDWAQIMMKMYIRWAEKKKFKTFITDESLGEIAGIKFVTLHVIGKYAYGLLKNETGIHRLIRKSPFNSNNKRHTSFSSAFIYPDINNNDDIEYIIKPVDLKIDVYKSSGAGGQHVNCTESAVRIKHIPTNIVVQCQNNRSQHKNKEQAINQIKSKLYQYTIQQKMLKKNEIEKNKSIISWGQQIRSYIIDNSIVKDLRTGLETNNIQEVLNGNIDQFINGNLKKS